MRNRHEVGRGAARESHAWTGLRLFLGASAIGLVIAVGVTPLYLSYGITPWLVLRGSLAWLYGWAALLPSIRWVALRFPLSEGPRKNYLVHVAALLAFAALGHVVTGVLLWAFGVSPSPVPTTTDTFVLGLIAYPALSTAIQLRAEGVRHLQDQAALDTLSRQLAEARLEALARQLQPHFLFNTLNAVSSFVSSDPERAEDMLEELANLLRASLGSPAGVLVPLADELALARMYVKIQQARLGDRLRVEFCVGEAVGQARVPQFLIQPLIENAIEHGVAGCEDGGFVRVVAERLDRALEIRVENPLPEDDVPTGSGYGIGLPNVRERLTTHYGDEASVTLAKDAGSGRATCTVRIPWEGGPG